MLRKKRWWGLIPALFAGLAFLGGCHRPCPEKMAAHVVEELVSKLELNTVQQEQLNAAKTEILAKAAAMKQSREAMHDQFITELGKEALDPGHLRQMVDSHKAEMDDMVTLLIDRLTRFHGALTGEQRRKLVELIKEKDKCRQSCFFSG